MQFMQKQLHELLSKRFMHSMIWENYFLDCAERNLSQ